jgi:phage tail sheath protein FI
VIAWRRRFQTSFATLSFPWCVVPDPLARGATRAIPPSGPVAGRMAAEDQARGVPGAGANAPIGWIADTSIAVDAAARGRLNEAGVNAITVSHWPGSSRLMGARSLSATLAWRFVTTRRVICAIRRQLTAALQWAVFEPNEHGHAADDRAPGGGLSGNAAQARAASPGATPDWTPTVRCDDTHRTTASDRANGRLIIEIGVAPAAPLEFIVLKLGKSADQLDIAGQGESPQPLLSEATP